MAITIGYLDMILSLILFLSFYWWYNRNSILINWPIIGMLPGLFANASKLHEKMTFVLRQSGGTFLFKGPWFGDLDYIATADPLNVHYVLTKHFTNYEKGAELKKIMEFVGGGIIATDGNDWKIRRRVIRWLVRDFEKLEVALVEITKMEILNNLLPILEHYSSTINGGEVVDLQDVFQRFTFDTICKLSLGFDPKSLSIGFPEDPCAKAFDDLSQSVITRHIIPSTVWKLQQKLQIGDERKFTQAWKIFDGFIYNCISDKTQQLKECKNINQINAGMGHTDLITKLIVADQDEEEVADVEKSSKFLRDIAFSLLIAGKDTVACALSWLFYLVSTNPDSERLILDEIKANLNLNDTEVFFRATEMRKLVYLHGAICETLRLYPPVPFERKVAIAPDTLPSGHHVEANTKVLFSFYSMGRVEEIWGKDCLEFKPERWITEQGKIKRVASNRFVAFNAGPRSCLGKEITFLQMKMIASWVLWNYHFDIVKGHRVLPINSIILYMNHGLKVNIVKRHAVEDQETACR